MGIVAPLSAVLTAAVPIAIGALLEGLPSFVQMTGFVCALVAVGLLAGSGDTGTSRRDLMLAFVSGISFGCYFVFLNTCCAASGLWIHADRSAFTAGAGLVLGCATRSCPPRGYRQPGQRCIGRWRQPVLYACRAGRPSRRCPVLLPILASRLCWRACARPAAQPATKCGCRGRPRGDRANRAVAHLDSVTWVSSNSCVWHPRLTPCPCSDNPSPTNAAETTAIDIAKYMRCPAAPSNPPVSRGTS